MVNNKKIKPFTVTEETTAQTVQTVHKQYRRYTNSADGTNCTYCTDRADIHTRDSTDNTYLAEDDLVLWVPDLDVHSNFGAARREAVRPGVVQLNLDNNQNMYVYMVHM